MAIAHTVSGEVVDLLSPGTTPEKSLALFKARDLEVIRVVLPMGKRMPQHRVAGSVTVQCLRGRIELSLPDQAAQLSAGQFAYVGGGVMHAISALEDSDVLVTIAIAAMPAIAAIAANGEPTSTTVG